jgi:PH (Pleckstrin Homology) domain-containing protein
VTRTGRNELALRVGGSAVAFIAAGLIADATGAVVAILAGAVLLLPAVFAMVFDPIVLADAAGVRIRPHTRWRGLGWAEVEAVRSARGRFGTEWLEVDTGESLVTVPGWRLGRPAAELADELEEIRVRASAGQG